MDQDFDNIQSTKQDHRRTKGVPRTKAGVRTVKSGRVNKSTSVARRNFQREAPLFTETYKALSAPIKEIFTSRYIPIPEPIKLVAINTKARETRKAANTSRPIRSTTTTQKNQQKESSSLPHRKSGSVYRQADYYRPQRRTDSSNNRERTGSSSTGRSHKDSSGNRVQRSTSDTYQSEQSVDHVRHTSSNIRETGDSSRGGSSSSGSARQMTNRSRRLSIHQVNHHNANGSNSNSNSNSNNGNDDSNNNGKRGETGRRNSRDVKIEPMEDVLPGGMELEEGPIVIKGIAPAEVEVSIKGESGPVTIEIENLDPGTTTEDVKVVCSRFGEIRSCICTNGFAQVTYARKAAGLAAVETLNGKKADNNQILHVTMRKTPVFHGVQFTQATHIPSPLAEPMRMLSKAVQGSINNVGSLYQEQLEAAQHILKVQQHRMAQLRMEEQRIQTLRTQTNGQFEDLRDDMF
ncbi:MAG: hypothetical protein J3Q66DRAFT_343468 [Benniella sp.]|nr:MAG: hypothetical protein J3Q66DRAFT_343468 [Benniella sp.]